MSTDYSTALVDGPWRHRFVSANGARFHVAEMGTGPLVVLLHGFPQFWWCWRSQLQSLASAGYRAAAMDLRGYGASDKPPRGYDTPTLAADVAGVIRSLGEPDAVVVGHDWGAWIAWSMPALTPAVTRAIVPVSVPHPLALRSALRNPAQLAASSYIAAFQVPVLPERVIRRGEVVARALRELSGPGWPSDEEVERYLAALRIPSVAHCALEYYRWLVRSRVRADGRRFTRAVRAPISVPVLHVQGGGDPVVLASSVRESSRWAVGPYEYSELEGVGHFVPEEAPAVFDQLLLGWLARYPG